MLLPLYFLPASTLGKAREEVERQEHGHQKTDLLTLLFHML